MTPFLRKLLGQNWLLLLIMLALAVFGVVAIYSATSIAQRPVCRRLLAETSKLGGRRCLRVHGDQFGPLPVDSLGRTADVPGRHCVSDPDEVYRGQSLWSAQLAASGTNQFSARAACGCSRDYGVGAVPDPVSPDASGTAITALGSDCGRAMSFDPDATRLGRESLSGFL